MRIKSHCAGNEMEGQDVSGSDGVIELGHQLWLFLL